MARDEIMWDFKKRSDTLLKEYDDKNNLIHVEHISGAFEAWHEYDDKNRQIHYKDSNGEETWFEYYDNGVLKNCTKLS